MKKLTRLMNYKTKQMKNVKTYNPFDTGDNNGPDGNDEMSHTKSNKKSKKFQMKTKSNNNHNKTRLEETFEPTVHNYHNKSINATTTTAAIASSTKTKAGGNKLFMPTTIAKKSKQQLKSSASRTTSSSSSTSRTTAYNGTDGGGNNINYASLDRMRNSSCNSTQSIKVNHKRKWPYLWWKRYGRHRKPKKSWRLKYKQSCWQQLRKTLSSCCKPTTTSASYQYNSDEDDDIDAKFNAYIFELKRRDEREAEEEEKKRAQLAQHLSNSNSSCNKEAADENCKIQLPTIKEAKAAAEELSRSPIMGQRNNDPTSSPIQSRGSGSSDNWPTQSDEDIDRLVAMHQNRSSLSSLGLRSDSMASVYSGAGEGRYGTVVVKGQVEFGMQYNYKLGALEIHVVRCKDLAAVDSKRNRSDPYVKVYLLPDKSKAGKRKTKVKKHTLNPIFDEVLRFHMPISSLESRTLWLTVWHSDMFGRNDFLGEVSVNLQGRVFDNPQSQWYLLQERSEPFDEVATYRGDIVVGLKYVTPEGSKSKFMRAASLATGGGLRKFGSIKSVASSKTDRSAKGGQLHVLVKEAKHLTPIKPNGSCDAFCKSYLLPDRTRSSKQKTPIVKRSTNPSWNYTFIYEDVSLEDLSERALELTVWDHDRLASNEFLGGVRFSLGTCKSYGRQVDWMDASGKELSLWQNMLDRPNFWVEGSVVLRSTLDGIRAIP